ncbi:retrotransposon protein, putative, ty1-copia subclass [Tanacetum coccineum]
MGYYFYFPPENKIVVARYAEFLEKNLISQEVSGRAVKLKEIQEEDTSPSENTSKIPMEVEEVEEHSLGDLNEPTNYKAALLDLESDKWLDAMNVEMQSIKDNQVRRLVDLPPNCKTVGRKWLFKKKTDMDGNGRNLLKPTGLIINPKAELRVDCYCNVGFETDRDEIKSQSGYVFILNGRCSRLEKLQVKYYSNFLIERLNRGIAPLAIIDRQLPFEYTIASRSTDVMVELKSMFEKQAGVERFDLIQTFHACKQKEGKPVGPYVIKIKNYVAQLKRIGYVLLQDISVGLILKCLTSDFVGFDDTCHHCKEVGHCKRNCPAYLAELIKKKKQVVVLLFASSSDVFIIELFSFPTKSWVYETSCGTLICNTKYGLGGVRKLKQVETIGSFDLVLPNGLMICLDNSHYAPSIIRGVVSVHRFTDFGISISKNNAIPSNCIYEIDMHDLVPNVNSIYKD